MPIKTWNSTIDPAGKMAGTLTCVARVADAPAKWVALSAAHVLAPLSPPTGPRPRRDDNVTFLLPDGTQKAGKLWSWIELQSVSDGFSNRFDAALAAVSDDVAKGLISALQQPAACSDARLASLLTFDGIMSRGTGVYDGAASTTPQITSMLGGGLASVAFMDCLQVRSPSKSGDSGALMTCDGRAVGMLIANEGNASIFQPLRALLSEFNLTWPETGAGKVLFSAAPSPIDQADEVDTLARTLWGEARGEPLSGIRAVAAVVMNRAEHPKVH